jgi:hypothetical protein
MNLNLSSLAKTLDSGVYVKRALRRELVLVREEVTEANRKHHNEGFLIYVASYCGIFSQIKNCGARGIAIAR